MNKSVSEDELKLLKFGDEVELHVSGNTLYWTHLVESELNWEWFKFLAFNSPNRHDNCIVLIPKARSISYWDLHDSVIDHQLSKNDLEVIEQEYGGWSIQSKSIRAIRKSTDYPISKIQTPPIPCVECKQFYPYAEPNFQQQLVCWSCRDSLRWKYGVDDTGKVYARN